MRIIRGALKGKRIQPPKKIRARPTTDFAKESLFNILNNSVDLDEIDVLDLFSGTGNISYEFISCGAQSVCAVDMDKVAIKFINQFKDENALDNLKIVHANVYAFLRTCKLKFDLIYADPPYGHKHVQNLDQKILESDILNDDGILIIEHGPETEYTNSPYLTDTRKYGGVNFSFFKKP